MTQAPTPGPLSETLTDPMERMVAEAFEAAGIGFKTNTACGLDFAIDGALSEAKKTRSEVIALIVVAERETRAHLEDMNVLRRVGA